LMLLLPLECFFRDRIVGDGFLHCNRIDGD
jgi:hypothetical protein